MPHSSGGGSHSGGGHSGSGGSFGGGGFGRSGASRITPVSRVSRHYGTGLNRFVYYVGDSPRFLWSDVSTTEEFEEKKTKAKHSVVISLIVCAVIILMIGFLLVQTGVLYQAKKLSAPAGRTVAVQDTVSVLDDADEQRLTQVFAEFTDKTGIVPELITVGNDEWQGSYDSLKNYAYDLYVNAFPDEKHWLLVYSTDGDEYFERWYWEGMQGDETDLILTPSVTDAFNDCVQKALTARSRYTIGQAFQEGFRLLLSKNLLGLKFDFGAVIPFCVMLLVLFLSIGLPYLAALVGNIRLLTANKGKQVYRVQTSTGQVQEDTCEYCQGMFLHGVHLSCPHCGAPVRPRKTEEPAT